MLARACHTKIADGPAHCLENRQQALKCLALSADHDCQRRIFCPDIAAGHRCIKRGNPFFLRGRKDPSRQLRTGGRHIDDKAALLRLQHALFAKIDCLDILRIPDHRNDNIHPSGQFRR